MFLADGITLVIFTCEGREYLLHKTYDSFLAACDYKFSRVILAIDGKINPDVIIHINPDLIINSYERKGYVVSIKNTLVNIDSPYFFWLEDDWMFHAKIDLPNFKTLLDQNSGWVQIAYSKYGPLTDEFKVNKAGTDLYENIYGFSANPGLNRTSFLNAGFDALQSAKKGDTLGEDGFENFLAKYFQQKDNKTILHDPVDHEIISHEGYLETTPRNWHMTNSLETKTSEHLLTIPKPSVFRKGYMILKLWWAFIKLSAGQLFNNNIYELCFRIIALAKNIKKGE